MRPAVATRDRVTRVDDRRKGTGSPTRGQGHWQQRPEHGGRRQNENRPEVWVGAEVRYVREQPLSPAEERVGGERIHQALGYPFHLAFTRQDTIARQPNGKYETFFADIPGPTGSPERGPSGGSCA